MIINQRSQNQLPETINYINLRQIHQQSSIPSNNQYVHAAFNISDKH